MIFITFQIAQYNLLRHGSPLKFAVLLDLNFTLHFVQSFDILSNIKYF